MSTLHRRAATSTFALTVAAVFLAACDDVSSTPAPVAPAAVSQNVDAGVHRQYGAPAQVGNGRARTYVTIDQKSGSPLEFGVAFDSTAMWSLPASMGGDPHHDHHEYLLPLPAQAPAPYKLVELDWNPQGHGDPYADPHFDFHFYTISLAERNLIDPADPQYAAKAANFPAADYLRPGWVCPCTIFNFPPVGAAVPRMGVHFIDINSPELYGAPFTTTMINGTWDGKVIFQEPMITRAFIQSKPDTTINLPLPQRANPAGWYPANYSIKYDAQAREYRIGLGALTWLQ